MSHLRRDTSTGRSSRQRRLTATRNARKRRCMRSTRTQARPHQHARGERPASVARRVADGVSSSRRLVALQACRKEVGNNGRHHRRFRGRLFGRRPQHNDNAPARQPQTEDVPSGILRQQQSHVGAEDPHCSSSSNAFGGATKNSAGVTLLSRAVSWISSR